MGWAKYQEDIVSRQNGTSRAQAALKEAAAPSRAAKPPSTSKRPPPAAPKRGERETAPRPRPKATPPAPRAATPRPATPPPTPAPAPRGAATKGPAPAGPTSRLKEFTASTARPLPVILLADVSGSMASQGKIDALNEAAREMLEAFSAEDDSRAEIHAAVITFGGGVARVHRPLGPASAIAWTSLAAAGDTPLGQALDLTKALLEDRAQVPSRAYRPTLILVSDGQPTGEWREALARLLGSERAAKATRFALGIGEDADEQMLEAFIATPGARVHQAHEARQIKQFFRWVTMSVTARTQSANPDSVVATPPTPIEAFDF